MVLKQLIVILFFVFFSSCSAQEEHDGSLATFYQSKTADPCKDSPIAGAAQLILSIVPSWNVIQSDVRFFELNENGMWQNMLGPMNAVVGRSGLAWGQGLHRIPEGTTHVKKEGDGRAPAGVFKLIQAFGYESEVNVHFEDNLHLPYHKVDQFSRCIDDTSSDFYNNMIYDERLVRKDWQSAEDLRRSDDLYKFSLVVDHNSVDKRSSEVDRSGKFGSCIFVHVWSGADHGTAGCTALSMDHAKRLLLDLKKSKNPLLVQLTRQDYDALKKEWGLPNL